MFQDSDSNPVYNPRKDLRLGPWDVIRKVFSSHEHSGMSVNDKASLFFQDYSMGPLFVQENYLRSIPTAATGKPHKLLSLVKDAAASLALGDIVDNAIRRNNAWSLLPVQAIFSSVLPGEYMEGTGMSGVDFPQWLGKNSNRNKRARLIQEVHNHVHLQISGSTDALNLDYLPYLRRSIVTPLSKGDIEDAAHRMTSYFLLRDDLESLNDLALWPNMRDNLDKLDSKSKAAFTRLVNKESFVPYSVVKVSKGRGKGTAEGEDELDDLTGEGEEEKGAEDEEDNEDVETDAMIKVKKPRAKAPAKPSSKSKNKK
jgi:replication factor C subunit 1